GLPDGVKISGVAGDQQAALFGQGCVSPGQSKNTYGTGCFLLLHTGAKPVASRSGLLTTVACDATGGAAYALEGSVFVGGAAVQWLRDGLGLIANAAEVEAMARDARARVRALQVDGGAVANDWLMQYQADLLGVPVRRPRVIETTA